MLDSPRIAFSSIQACPTCGAASCICDVLRQGTARRIQTDEQKVQKGEAGAKHGQSWQADRWDASSSADGAIGSHSSATAESAGLYGPSGRLETSFGKRGSQHPGLENLGTAQPARMQSEARRESSGNSQAVQEGRDAEVLPAGGGSSVVLEGHAAHTSPRQDGVPRRDSLRAAAGYARTAAAQRGEAGKAPAILSQVV